MDLREIGIDGANWIQLVQDRIQWWACVNTVMNLRAPLESRIFFDKLSDIFSNNILHHGVSKCRAQFQVRKNWVSRQNYFSP
jgi:hypothetical protein